jgi:signal transduction histidine kinase
VWGPQARVASVTVLEIERYANGHGRAKAEAVVETAVTINHEVNNPLTAVLGNIQLVLMNADRLPADILTRLKAAEQSALKIKEVTQNLMKIVEPSVIEYTTGLKMVDLSKSILQKTEDENKKKPDK